MTQDWYLNSEDDLTKIVKVSGVNSWNELTEFIQQLPYGRNKNRTDLSLVLSEKKGTCSSKHALIKELAIRNKIPEIKLIIGMYKMNHHNTPKIGKVLLEKSIEYLPEAHCYLKINDVRTDFTTKKSAFKKIENDIIKEWEITPDQVSDFKVGLHKKFLKNWLSNSGIAFDFDEIWRIREQCIANLTE